MGNVTGPLPWKGVKSSEPEWKKCLALNTLKEVGKPEAGILIRYLCLDTEKTDPDLQIEKQ